MAQGLKIPESWFSYPIERDFAWVSRHWEELKKKYPGKFIAVREQKVVDSDEDEERLKKRIEKKFGSAFNAVVIYIPSEEPVLMF